VKYGFVIEQSDNTPFTFLIKSIEYPSSSSELEAFRRKPVDIDTALTLHKTYPREVEVILKYEALTNPARGPQGIATAMYFFREIKDWKTYIAIAQDGLKTANTGIRINPTPEKLNIRATILHDLARAYFYNNELNKARQTSQQITAAHLHPSQFLGYLQLIYLIMVRSGRPEKHVKLLENLRQSIPPEAMGTYEAHLLGSRYLVTLHTKPDQQAASGLISDWRALNENHPNHALSVTPFSLLWVMLCAGKPTDGLRESHSNYLAGNVYKGTYESLAFEAFILDREGAVAPARVKAKEALNNLKDACLDKNEEALVFSRYNAVIATLTELAREPIEAEPRQTVKAASEPPVKTVAVSQPALSDVIFGNEWDNYHKVFPKALRERIARALVETINISINLLSVSNLSKSAAEEVHVIDPQINKAANALGISSISVVWDNGLIEPVS
jgi:hypothetical protein